jgi:chromosome segregation ATPase
VYLLSNEEFQKLVLEKLSDLESKMDTRLDGLEVRLERNEQMTADLIRIVGHTNAMVEEMRADMDVMKADIDVMKADIDVMKADIDVMKADIDVMKADIDVMKADIDVMKADIDIMKGDIEEIKTDQHHFAFSLGKQRVMTESLLERFLEHDADIKTLRKAVYLHE